MKTNKQVPVMQGLKKTKTLVVITGISGTGKTTLASEMSKFLDVEMLSFDDFKVQQYETYGFTNEQERLKLWNDAKMEFLRALKLRMFTGATVIVEFPFNTTWQEDFDILRRQYQYELVILNCNTRDFDDIWKKKVERDTNPDTRRDCLGADAYVKGRLCTKRDAHNKEYVERHR